MSASPRTLSGVGHLTSPLLHGTSPRSTFMPGLSAAAMGGNGSMDRQSPILSPARQRMSQHSPLNGRPTKQEMECLIIDFILLKGGFADFNVKFATEISLGFGF